ncbi:MAG: hypothetical protein HQ568_01830 [Calditrichaeota bacterium]|nr:hypothetical protein [Calditrichota bacterium]
MSNNDDWISKRVLEAKQQNEQIGDKIPTLLKGLIKTDLSHRIVSQGDLKTYAVALITILESDSSSGEESDEG